jgi:hypothetical protein
MKKSNYFIKTDCQRGAPPLTRPGALTGPGTLGPGPHTFFLAVWWTLPAYPGPLLLFYIFFDQKEYEIEV